MGALTRVVLFTEAFGREPDVFGSCRTDIGTMRDDSDYDDASRSPLVMMIGGEHGRSHRMLTNAEVREWANRVLEGCLRNRPTSARVQPHDKRSRMCRDPVRRNRLQ